VILPAIGGDVDHVAAKTPSCTENGNIEYWHCAECDQYWQDEALTQLTNVKNVVLGASCKYNAVHTEGIEAGCHYTGRVENWYCANCDVYYLDADCTIITNYKNLTIPALKDTADYVAAKTPTCTENGNVEYWTCAECEQVWTDAALTQLSNLKNVQIAPSCKYNAVHTEGIEPGCHYTGWTENWYCANCDVYYLDADCTIITNYKNLVIPALGSENLQHVAYKAPTATENGNIEYWFCPDCEQYWQDEALTQLTNAKNVIIPATGEVEEPETPEKPETPDSPVTGESSVAVVVALLALIASGVAVVLLKDKKRA
jgi:ribosomal protein L37AE/L43A